MPLTTSQVIPTFRIFDVGKAKDFYVDYLGFTIDWEHRFEDTAPLYMQVSLGSFQLHLSEHYGDGCPRFDRVREGHWNRSVSQRAFF